MHIGDPGHRAETVGGAVERFGELADAGAQHLILSTRDVWNPARLDTLGNELIPRLRTL